MVQRTLLNLLRLFRDRAPMVQRTLLNLLRLLLLFRAQARKAQGPIVFLRILFFFFFLTIRAFLGGQKMVKNS